jgi:hypothetical protein
MVAAELITVDHMGNLLIIRNSEFGMKSAFGERKASQSFSPAGEKEIRIRVFRGRVPRKTHVAVRKCAGAARARGGLKPLKRLASQAVCSKKMPPMTAA